MPFLDNSRHLARVWWSGTRSNVIREVEFRSNFILGLLRQLVWLGIFIFTIEIIFQQTESLAGWSQAEVLIVLALSRLIEGLMNTLFTDNIMSIPPAVQRGTFDFYLTKPVPVQFYTTLRDASIYSLGNVVAGIVLLGYALTQLPSAPLLLSSLAGVALAVMGIVIFYSLLMTVVSFVFFLERLEALWGFVHLFSEPLTVPFDIFPRYPRLAITYLLPLAFVVFVPAQALTGHLAWWQFPVAVLITLFLLLLSNAMWRAGLRRYTSASS